MAVFPGNNSDLFEKDRGAVGFEHFAEIFCGSCAVGSQIFSNFDTLELEIASARWCENVPRTESRRLRAGEPSDQ